MTRLDDAGMDRPDGDLVDALAADAHERVVIDGGSGGRIRDRGIEQRTERAGQAAWPQPVAPVRDRWSERR